MPARAALLPLLLLSQNASRLLFAPSVTLDTNTSTAFTFVASDLFADSGAVVASSSYTYSFTPGDGQPSTPCSTYATSLPSGLLPGGLIPSLNVSYNVPGVYTATLTLYAQGTCMLGDTPTPAMLPVAQGTCSLVVMGASLPTSAPATVRGLPTRCLPTHAALHVAVGSQ